MVSHFVIIENKCWSEEDAQCIFVLLCKAGNHFLFPTLSAKQFILTMQSKWKPPGFLDSFNRILDWGACLNASFKFSRWTVLMHEWLFIQVMIREVQLEWMQYLPRCFSALLHWIALAYTVLFSLKQLYGSLRTQDPRYHISAEFFQ